VDLAIILFGLRVLSALILLLLVLVLIWVIWRDYRATMSQITASRRAHGSLIVMQEIEGAYVLTGDIYPLLPLTSIGRSPTNTIRIEDTFASSEHALITRRNGQWWLEDRRSRNGTTLNGIAITKPVVITNGDMIGIGHIRYRVNLET
jgi:hypothetical protein